jgi:hypothetical protein
MEKVAPAEEAITIVVVAATSEIMVGLVAEEM